MAEWVIAHRDFLLGQEQEQPAAIELTWRVTNGEGMRWAWNTLAKAQAQIALWESQGARGFVSPVFRADGRELTSEELEAWVAAANRALTPQQESEGHHG
jgi:hypothetical protein